MAQLVEQLIRNQQVSGSNPLSSSIKKEYFFKYSFLMEVENHSNDPPGGIEFPTEAR